MHTLFRFIPSEFVLVLELIVKARTNKYSLRPLKFVTIDSAQVLKNVIESELKKLVTSVSYFYRSISFKIKCEGK